MRTRGGEGRRERDPARQLLLLLLCLCTLCLRVLFVRETPFFVLLCRGVCRVEDWNGVVVVMLFLVIVFTIFGRSTKVKN